MTSRKARGFRVICARNFLKTHTFLWNIDIFSELSCDKKNLKWIFISYSTIWNENSFQILYVCPANGEEYRIIYDTTMRGMDNNARRTLGECDPKHYFSLFECHHSLHLQQKKWDNTVSSSNFRYCTFYVSVAELRTNRHKETHIS